MSILQNETLKGPWKSRLTARCLCGHSAHAQHIQVAKGTCFCGSVRLNKTFSVSQNTICFFCRLLAKSSKRNQKENSNRNHVLSAMDSDKALNILDTILPSIILEDTVCLYLPTDPSQQPLFSKHTFCAE